MIYRIQLFRDDQSIATLSISADDAVQLLTTVAPPSGSQPSAQKRPQLSKETGNSKWQKLSDERSTRSRLTDEKKKQIENLLIEGISVKEIIEAVGVSKPTIYVIKARLKKEGRLA